MARSADGDAPATTPSDADVPPIPPRFRWLKRLLIAAAVYAAFLAGVRVWWGWEADRRLESRIAAWRAAGQPVLLADFARDPVPDAENAVVPLRQALQQMQPPGAETDYFLSADRYGVLDIARLERLATDNATMLRFVRQSRDRPEIDWQAAPASPIVGAWIPAPMGEMRAAVRITLATAYLRHVQGRTDEALEHIRDALHVGRAVGRSFPALIPLLVRTATDALTLHTLEAMIATVPLAAPDDSTIRPAAERARTAAEALLRELRDEAEPADNWRRAAFSERMIVLDTLDALKRGTLTMPALGAPGPLHSVDRLAFEPSWTMDALRPAEMWTALADIHRHGLDDERTEFLARHEDPNSHSPAFVLAHRLREALLTSPNLVVQQHLSLLALRRMAATALALRLFESDHGHRPDALAALVPEYLPAVPVDPFDPDGGPIGYLPNADPPRLYSVGEDGVDDGGAFALTERGDVQRRHLDMPYFLNGDRPRSPPPPQFLPDK